MCHSTAAADSRYHYLIMLDQPFCFLFPYLIIIQQSHLHLSVVTQFVPADFPSASIEHGNFWPKLRVGNNLASNDP